MPASSSSAKAFLPVWVLLTGIALAAPLVGGASHPAVVGALTLFSGLMLMVAGRSRRKQGRRMVPGPLPAVVAAGAAWSFLQCVPLPAAWVRALSPATAQLREVVLPAGLPAWSALSADPLSTLLAAAHLVTLACVLAVALDLAREEQNRPRLLWLVSAAGVGVLALGLAHWLTDHDGPEGLLLRANSAALMVTPFPEPAHGGALLSLAAFAMLGLALGAFTTAHAINWGVGAAVCTLGVLLCGATTALAGMLAGVVLTAVLVWRGVAALRQEERSGRPAPRRGSRTLSLVAVALLPPLVLLAVDRPSWLGLVSWESYAGPKLEAFRQAWPLLGRYALTGMGLGTFAEVFPQHKTAAWNATFSTPGNAGLLVLLEWGVPVTLLLGALGVRALRRLHVDAPSEAGGAVLGGLLALGLDNAAEVSLSSLGVMLPAALLLASLHRPAKDSGLSTDARRRQSRRSTGRALGLGAAAALACLPAFWCTRYGWNQGRAQAWNKPLPERAAALQAHVESHPTDYLAVTGILRVLAATAPQRPELQLPWANRLLFLNPTWPEAHLVAGRVLWGLGLREQAALEFHAAQRLRPRGTDEDTLDELARLGLAVDEMGQVFEHRSLRWVCEQLDHRERPGLAESCWQRLAWLRPDDAGAMAAVAERAWAQGNAAQAEQSARLALAAEPGLGRAAVVLARVLSAQGAPDAADRVLEDARTARPDPAEVDRERFERALARGDLAAARKALAQWNASVVRRGASLEDAMVAEGRLEERAGNVVMALQHYRNAARASPQHPDAALRAAELASAHGKDDMALSILKEAALDYPHPRYTEAIQALEAGPSSARLRGKLHVELPRP